MLKSINTHSSAAGAMPAARFYLQGRAFPALRAAPVRVSGVWDPSGTWRSDGRCAAPGTAWLLSPALQQRKTAQQHSQSLSKTLKELQVLPSWRQPHTAV